MAVVATPIEDIPTIREALRSGFQSGKTRPIEFRRTQLIQLGYLIQDNIQRFHVAFHNDLGRPDLESDFFELHSVLNEVKEAVDNLKYWTKTEKLPFSFNWFAMRPAIRKEPKGVVMIISPFNFPVFLLLGPLVGALAAGNAVLLKPSELTPAIAALLTELIPQYLDQDVVRVVNGAIPETTKLLECQWDHILYTGNGRVGKIISSAAAKNLTPVSTELGGKNPVFIDPNSDLKLAARRTLWAKQANAGQVCLAPDYVLVPRDTQDRFVEELKEVYSSFYPDPAAMAESFTHIVSQSHAQRIKNLLDGTKGTIVLGGETDVEKKYVALTVVRDVQEGDSLLSDEIFGPVLSLVPVQDVNEAIAYVNKNDNPLALYVFSQDDAYKSQVFDQTQSGACLANELVLHTGTPGLPFGGVGPSGSGHWTGKFSFDMFTHLRPTMDSPSWLDKHILAGRFPPYTQEKHRAIKNLTKVKLPPRPKSAGPEGARARRRSFWFVLAAVGVFSGLLIENGKILGWLKA